MHEIKNQASEEHVQNDPLLDHNPFMFNIFGVTGTSEHLTK